MDPLPPIWCDRVPSRYHDEWDFLGQGRSGLGKYSGTEASLPYAHAMIPVSFPWFVALYLALFLAGVLVLWLGYEWIRRRLAKEAARTRIFCRICGSRYTDASSKDLLDCPVCGSRNERSA